MNSNCNVDCTSTKTFDGINIYGIDGVPNKYPYKYKYTPTNTLYSQPGRAIMVYPHTTRIDPKVINLSGRPYVYKSIVDPDKCLIGLYDRQPMRR
jgi:hypothetical protein